MLDIKLSIENTVYTKILHKDTVSDCCLTPYKQWYSYIMMCTSYIR